MVDCNEREDDAQLIYLHLCISLLRNKAPLPAKILSCLYIQVRAFMDVTYKKNETSHRNFMYTG